MAWSSILPESLQTLETWITRTFVILGLITIGPWAILIIYDFVLYVVRTLLHEVPVFGGRAQGHRRPRAPSLSERPSGRPRNFSLVGHGRPELEGTKEEIRARRAKEYDVDGEGD